MGISLGLILVCASAGIFFIGAALHAWLTPQIGPVGAGLALGALLLAPAVTFAITHLIARRSEARLVAERSLLEADSPQEQSPLISLAIGALSTLFRARPLAAAGFATALGALAARYPRQAAALVRRVLPRVG